MIPSRGSRSSPLGRQERFILALLLLLAAAAWAVTIQQSSNSSIGMGLTMGFSGPLFLGIWIVMMIAMMFPSGAPMFLMFSRIARGKRERGQSFVPTWVFVASYLAVWSASGVIAYLVASEIQSAGMGNMWLQNNGPRLAGLLFLAAGLYQLSPLKTTCLAKCQSPLSFIMTSWRDGYGGAVRMGVSHGLFCLGCCWLLFAILFPLGIMNIAAMAVVAIVVFAEKTISSGLVVTRLLAAGLMGYGALIVALPQLLPLATSGMS